MDAIFQFLELRKGKLKDGMRGIDDDSNFHGRCTCRSMCVNNIFNSLFWRQKMILGILFYLSCGLPPLPPLPPIGCDSMQSVCVCGEDGDCHWEFQCIVNQ